MRCLPSFSTEMKSRRRTTTKQCIRDESSVMGLSFPSLMTIISHRHTTPVIDDHSSVTGTQSPSLMTTHQ
ncbi:hypothetical protein BRADI_2g62442v3 [Brachypodium distachyon]|uniref:Uncharacterized protein n=1 Tax=Brachypodium distachyon TaxID=15368 RepID=A0A2K2DHE1_BRADI|nr:hypothetical protein BRADI_2g62442v3 [Brachypodium distachyon]